MIRKGGTDGDPLFRGMAGSRVAIVSDDAMLLGGCGMRMDPPTAYVFPENYDRIRVLKGPQSVLWGAGGSAATVLFERDPFDASSDGSRVDASVLTASWGAAMLPWMGSSAITPVICVCQEATPGPMITTMGPVSRCTAPTIAGTPAPWSA